MVTALIRAVAALSLPTLRRVVVLGLGLSVLVFALVWLGVAAALYDTALFSWRALDWLVELLGGLTALVLSWLLFPAVATVIMSFFLNRVAAAIEAVDYFGHDGPRRQPWGEASAALLRLSVTTVILNVLVLPLYLLVPGINLVLFLTLNGYLFGRGYFEVVALRHLDTAGVKALRHRFGGRIFLGGLAIAGMFALPLVNLVAPVIATAFMVHVFNALPDVAPLPATRSAA